MRGILIVAASVAALASGSAQAATATGSLGVSISIAAACTVAGGTLNFGSQGVLAANVDQTGTFGVTCTNTTAYTVGLDNGANASGVQRRMKGGATNTEFVNYGLFSDAGRATAWTSAATVAGTGNGAAQTLTVYGRVPSQTTGSPGAYSDTVTITVTY